MPAVLGLDAMDVSGEQQLDIDHNIFKQRLDASGELVTEPPVKEGTVNNRNFYTIFNQCISMYTAIP